MFSSRAVGTVRIKDTRFRSYGLRCWHCLVLCLLLFISAIQVEGIDPLPDAAKGWTGSVPPRASGLRKVVDDWTSGDATKKESVRLQYGPIKDWDVSQVTTMSHLFYDKNLFSDDISKWIIPSKVTSMHLMFYKATAFSSSLANWDVSHVMVMSSMFNEATDFNGDVSKWVSREVLFAR